MLIEGTGVVWYSMPVKVVSAYANPFRYMAKYFSIWHEPLRGGCVTGLFGRDCCVCV